MQPLDKTLRNQLERAVKNARDTAETGARATLDQLGVADPTPAAHLGDKERELRRRLRAHGRQLGDSLNGGKVQSMDRLVEEVAYEHWHRMLFARFLSENDLLMYPDPDEPVAITLEECEDLAADEGAANGWELAARYAARMLPQIFRLDSPVFQLTLPPEHQQALEREVGGLPLEVFTASDSLGWVYQFWQARKKEQVNQSEVKIGARELPAVTQLFTEPYMVSFLLDNSLGAWWAARQLSESDLKHAESEEELRQKAAISGVPLEYLRFVKQDDGAWTPAAGTFDAWPEQLADLKTLDPCCGSGHFLVAALLMLVPMRMERDGLSARDAVDAVLRENIHGLELDQRCVELAAFALALTAWNYPEAKGYRPLPELHLACTGLSISSTKQDWLKLAGENTEAYLALEELYEHFNDAPVLGSLINPKASLRKGSLFEQKWDEVGPLISEALDVEKEGNAEEKAVVALGLAKATEIISKEYNLLSTNVPYLGQIKQSEKLRNYCVKNYFDAKSDIAYVFMMRSFDFLDPSGHLALVMPLGWMFQTSEESLRSNLIKNFGIKYIAKLGRNAFETSVGADICLSIFSKRGPEKNDLTFIDDLFDAKTVEEKSEKIKGSIIEKGPQNSFNNNHANTIFFQDSSAGQALDSFSDKCDVIRGLSTGETNRFYRYFWEVDSFSDVWSYLRDTADQTEKFSGMSFIIKWENEAGELADLAESLKHLNHAVQSWRRGKPYWGRCGISINRMANLNGSLYLGERFTDNVGIIVPHEESLLAPIWEYVSSGELAKDLRKINTKLAVEPRYLKALKFDLNYWNEVAEEKYPKGLPKPYTDDPTQWIFHGHICGSVVWNELEKWTAEGPLRTDNTVLQVAVARLLGYRWPAELDTEMELADEQREWVKLCEALLPFADEDGIVCIPPVRGEASAADRLLNLLAAAYGDAWSTDVLAELLKSAGHAGKTLETWLRDKFFTQHCKLFQNRPFIWHIWDGLPDGFSALVNYHKLDRGVCQRRCRV